MEVAKWISDSWHLYQQQMSQHWFLIHGVSAAIGLFHTKLYLLCFFMDFCNRIVEQKWYLWKWLSRSGIAIPLKCQTTHFLCEVIIGEIFSINDWCHDQTGRRLNSESWFSSFTSITHVFRFKEYYSKFAKTHGIGHNDINFVFP